MVNNWRNKMGKYKFEIKKIINIVVESNNVEDARACIIHYLEDGAYDDDLREDAYVSNGVEIKLE